MAISLKREHLKRYKDLARLFMKYGHGDLLSASGLDQALEGEERPSGVPSDPKAEELAADLERMGPIYVKLGQVLSSRADLLPPPYVAALSRLQDRLEPFPYEEVEGIVRAELGVRISKAFSEFETTPIATASLGQVHRAALRDGRPVAVKVQRPGIREQIADDFEVLHDICEFLDGHTQLGNRIHFVETLDQFRRTLLQELDYRQEARNLVEIGEGLRDFERIVVPRPVEDYSTSRILTMDYIRGRKITSISPLARMELDGAALAEQLFEAYLKQTLVDGFFHADPHPGNVFLTDDRRIALIDLGMVGRIAPALQEQLLKLILAVSEGDADGAAETALRIGELAPNFDEPSFRRQVALVIDEQRSRTGSDAQVGKAVLEFARGASESGVRLPTEMTLLGKTLLALDEVARTLDPAFDPNDAVRRNAAQIIQQRFMQDLSPGNLFAAAMEAREFAGALPGRVNRILDALAKNQLKLQVEAIDEATLIEGFQKVANRITTGLVLAALIIGAAMLMHVETPFRIFGYPGLAMLCFMAAAGGGFWLVFSIMASDRAARKK